MDNEVEKDRSRLVKFAKKARKKGTEVTIRVANRAGKDIHHHDEHIHFLLKANDETLSVVIKEVKVHHLFIGFSDMSLEAKALRKTLLRHLCVEKIQHLNAEARAHLLVYLQKIGNNIIPEIESMAYSLLSHSIEELRMIRVWLDNIGNCHSLHNLVYQVLSDKSRLEFLELVHKIQHLAQSKPLKILSDVDDTFICTGGHKWNRLAGCDNAYPWGTVYPGVSTFYKELDLGHTSEQGNWPLGQAGQLAFLSARPKGTAEKVSYGSFGKLYSSGKIHTRPTILAGDMDGLKMIYGDFEPMALKKYTNFVEYAHLYPDFDFVFIGDNGQGDARAGELILGDKIHSGKVKAIFIHIVKPLSGTYGIKEDPSEHWKKLIFFDTYIGAATKAFALGLIHKSGIERVIESARKEFTQVTFKATKNRRRELAMNALNIDLVEAGILLGKQIEPIKL